MALSHSWFYQSSRILAEIVGNLAYFPIWWYTKGLIALILGLVSFLIDRDRGLGFSVWFKNIFRPMYGQNDWEGVLISLVMRIFQVIFRGLAMFFWVLMALAVLVLWLAAPGVIVINIIYQIAA